jgi:transcriptional regulator with XRE-family HTH domain
VKDIQLDVAFRESYTLELVSELATKDGASLGGIFQELLDNGISRRDIAFAFGVSPATIHKWRKGKEPSWEMLRLLMDLVPALKNLWPQMTTFEDEENCMECGVHLIRRTMTGYCPQHDGRRRLRQNEQVLGGNQFVPPEVEARATQALQKFAAGVIDCDVVIERFAAALELTHGRKAFSGHKNQRAHSP